MAASDINRSLVSELEAMGFSEDRAIKALQSSGSSSLEAAVNWIIDHENDTDVDEMPMVQVDIIETPSPTFESEQVKLKAQELRERARKRREEGEKRRLEREREKERIRVGKELLATKRMADENERKRFQAQRKADKEEEKRARERIRQKLQQDMAERRTRLGSSMNTPTAPKSIKTSDQEIRNPLIVESAKSGNSATKKEVLMECLRSLRRQHKEEDTKVQRAFQTLLIYVRNIVSNPEEGKFRKIRLSNPAFQARVGIFKEGVQFLQLCGFERVESGDFLLLGRDRVDMKLLRSAGMALHSAITNPFFGLFSK